jgi:hypothetical protein
VYHLSQHALDRMDARGLPAEAVRSTLAYGRAVWTRGACVHVIGRKEVRRYRRAGLDLAPYEGVHVVVSPEGTVLTVYRNRDLRGLRRDTRRRPGGDGVVDSEDGWAAVRAA